MTTSNRKQWFWIVPLAAIAGLIGTVGFAAADKEEGAEGGCCKMMGGMGDAKMGGGMKGTMGSKPLGSTPGALLSRKDELKLTPEQTAKLDEISKKAQAESKAVLTPEQTAKLDQLKSGSGCCMMGSGGMMGKMPEGKIKGMTCGQTMDCAMVDGKMECSMMDMKKADSKATDAPATQPSAADAHAEHHH